MSFFPQSTSVARLLPNSACSRVNKVYLYSPSLLSPPISWGFPVTQTVKNLPAIWKTWVWSLGWKDPLEKGMATHNSILAWRMPWTGEPGGLRSMGSQRVRHDWVTNTFTLSCFSLYWKLVPQRTLFPASFPNGCLFFQIPKVREWGPYPFIPILLQEITLSLPSKTSDQQMIGRPWSKRLCHPLTLAKKKKKFMHWNANP